MTIESVKETYDLRELVYRKVLEATGAEPRVIRAAKCLAQFLMEKRVYISPHDLLAGNAQYCNCAYSHPKDIREEITCYEEKTGIIDPRMDIFEAGLNAKLYQRGQGGHVIAAYDYVLEHGVDALIETAARYSRAPEGEARDLAEASLIVCTALSNYIERYAEEARSLNMDQLASTCAAIAHRPPESFIEAVQLMWLLHEVVIFEQYCGSMSLGRLDLTLYDFYQKDTEKGILSREEARKIIEAFFTKLGGLKRGYQNVTLGGTDAKGRLVDNDITRICLEVSKCLMIDQPLLSMRYTPEMSSGLWEAILDLMQTGIGFPAMFNDALAIESKIKAGIEAADAANYGIVGCVEVSVPGKEFAHTEGLRLNWAKILELMFNGGKCRFTGFDFGLLSMKRLDSIHTFEEFYEWYKAELVHFLTLAMEVNKALDTGYGENWPTPYMSSLMRGCIQKGKDVNAGGAVYNLTTVNGCGMANAVDSLCAIQKVVFEDKLCDLPRLAEILASDFEADENIHHALLKRCPKFGNDDDRADLIMRELTDLFCKTVNACRNPRGGSFQTGLYSVDHHMLMGKVTAALPDGRRSKISLANGFSPVQGADVKGPTALINSIVKNDLSQLGNGMVFDLKFHPGFFRENRPQIKALIETYFSLGGYEIQLNVVDRNTLIEAQKFPDRYKNLIVRVSGFSAYFTDLNAALQDEIIARTEYGNQ